MKYLHLGREQSRPSSFLDGAKREAAAKASKHPLMIPSIRRRRSHHPSIRLDGGNSGNEEARLNIPTAA